MYAADPLDLPGECAGCVRIVEQARRQLAASTSRSARTLVDPGRVNIFERLGVAGGAGDLPQQGP
jgi:hypothetical protein